LQSENETARQSMTHRTLQSECENFKRAVYKAGMTAEQEKQVHGAFFAGAVSIMKLVDEAADPKLSDRETLMKCNLLRTELAEQANALIVTAKNRN
jgi:hypothetical protein